MQVSPVVLCQAAKVILLQLTPAKYLKDDTVGSGERAGFSALLESM